MTPDPAAARLVDVDAVAVAVMSCPAVVGLSAGTFGEVVTHLPGRRVLGVKVTGDRIDVHIVARWVPYLPDAADEVRRQVAPLAAGRAVNVFIEDLSTGADDAVRA